MICEFCQYEHDNEGDRYGCPNCLGGEVEINSDEDPETVANSQSLI